MVFYLGRDSEFNWAAPNRRPSRGTDYETDYESAGLELCKSGPCPTRSVCCVHPDASSLSVSHRRIRNLYGMQSEPSTPMACGLGHCRCHLDDPPEPPGCSINFVHAWIPIPDRYFAAACQEYKPHHSRHAISSTYSLFFPATDIDPSRPRPALKFKLR